MAIAPRTITAPSGLTIYAIAVRIEDGQYARFASGSWSFEIYDPLHVGLYAVAMPETAGMGIYSLTFPDLPIAYYTSIYFVQTGGSPAAEPVDLRIGSDDWDLEDLANPDLDPTPPATTTPILTQVETRYGQVLNGVIGEIFRSQKEAFGVDPANPVVAATWIVKHSLTDPDSLAVFLGRITIDPDNPLGQITATGVTTGLLGLLRLTVAMPTAPTAARLDVAFDTPAAISLFAQDDGYPGNNITFQCRNAGAGQNLSVTTTPILIGTNPVGSAIVVTLATDGSSVITSTASDVVNLLNTDLTTSLLIFTSVASAGLASATAILDLVGGNEGTATLVASSAYPYQILLTFYDSTTHLLETGTFTLRSRTDTTPLTATISGARASITASPRVDQLVNRYIDSSLDVFRRLKVWDQHGLRSGNDPFEITFPYNLWNPSYTPQVYDSQNNRVTPNRVTIDYDKGSVWIDGDPGHLDYFVTYVFDYFGPEILQAWVDLTVQELNVAGSEGRYTTAYGSVDATPPSWDAPIYYGVLVKAFRKLATDTLLWNTRMIWANGPEAQQLAQSLASEVSMQFQTLSAGLKWGRFLAKPTLAFWVFQTTGWGGYSPYSGRFQGYTTGNNGLGF